ncbi:MAG: 50S ribosomal protein L5 [Clostridia bacterium]
MAEFYKSDIVPALMKKFGYKNINQVPKLEKVVLNMGLGDVKDNSKSLELAIEELKMIAGQTPQVAKAKKSVANFKVREGMVIGAKVTLRSSKMFDFVDKFISVALPRVRDFKGVSADSFDGRGSYCVGVKEQLIFPEISYEKIEKVRGMDVCFVTTAKTDAEAKELLRLFGMPFAK